MNFDISTANMIQLAIYVALAVVSFVVLIKFLKFVAGVIVGFAVTMILAYLYYLNYFN